jgi:prepilin-type N-terminal cleavage/methylation domain-containing protein
MQTKENPKNFRSKKLPKKPVLTNARLGMTLPELLICLTIVAILIRISLPNYLNTINATRQKDTANEISNIQSTIMAFREEFLTPPATWDDLTRISPISTYSSANVRSNATGNLTTAINPNQFYTVTLKTIQSNRFQITGTHKVTPLQWKIQACIDTETGVSDMELGRGDLAETSVSCG